MIMLIQKDLPNSLSTELPFASDPGKQQNNDLFAHQSPRGVIWKQSLNNKSPLDHSEKSNFNGEGGSKITSSGVVGISETTFDMSDKDTINLASNWDGFVYKRKRVRSNTVMSDKDAFTNTASKWGGFVYKRRRQKRDTVMFNKDMFISFSSKWDGFVYKRRQIRRKTDTLVSDEDAIDHDEGTNGPNSSIASTGNPLTVQKNTLPKVPVFTKGGCFRHSLDCENSAISKQNHVQKANVIPSLQIIGAKNSASLLDSNRNHKLFVVALPAGKSDIHRTCSLSKSNTARSIMKTIVDCGERSSSDAIVKESLVEFTLAREFCIYVLRRHGLLSGMNTTSTCASSEIISDNDASISRPCKICGLPENPLKMIICDLCEDAFHVSCCQPKVKKILVDYWYCHPCFRARPKSFEKRSGKSANILSERIYRESHGTISWMLGDKEPYKSDVRIGKAFQVEVPQWTGPISEDFNYFDEHLELDLAECVSLNVQSSEMLSQFTSFGNWIQCREVIHTQRKDKGIVCGKWRRAPLFVVQTAKWDCSCAVLWDPGHADCAVPQELETDVILEHLKYFEMLRPQLNITRQIPQETITNHR